MNRRLDSSTGPVLFGGIDTKKYSYQQDPTLVDVFPSSKADGGTISSSTATRRVVFICLWYPDASYYGVAESLTLEAPSPAY